MPGLRRTHLPAVEGALVPFLVGEFRSFVVFSVQQHLPHLRENICDLGRLEGLMRHEHAFVTENDLLRVWIARHLDIDRSIAGDEKSITAGGDAAKAPPRHNRRVAAVPPAASARFSPRRQVRVGVRGNFWQKFISARTTKIFGGTNLLGHLCCLPRGCS